MHWNSLLPLLQCKCYLQLSKFGFLNKCLNILQSRIALPFFLHSKSRTHVYPNAIITNQAILSIIKRRDVHDSSFISIFHLLLNSRCINFAFFCILLFSILYLHIKIHLYLTRFRLRLSTKYLKEIFIIIFHIPNKLL